MKRIQLVLEPADNGFWGRVDYNQNLIVEHADSIDALQDSMRKLLFDFHEVTDVTFDLAYDLYAFFEKYDYLKISKIAQLAGMNPSLLRHYKAQTKYPSADQVKRIETAVHLLANELAEVHLVAA